MTTVVHEAVRAPRALISERRLLIVILVICLLGIADAGYLTYVHY